MVKKVSSKKVKVAAAAAADAVAAATPSAPSTKFFSGFVCFFWTSSTTY